MRVIRCPENRGAGAARKVGVREARGEIVVMLDADGSYPAESIREILAHFPAYDQVNGARTSEQGTHPLAAAAGQVVHPHAGLLSHRLPHPRPEHRPEGLQARGHAALAVGRARRLQLRHDDDAGLSDQRLRREVRDRAVSSADRQKQVPSRSRTRWAYLATVLRMVLYFRPLKIFLPLAGLLMACGVLKSLWSFQRTGSMQESDIVVFVAGFMTAMLGLLAEVIVAHHRR